MAFAKLLAQLAHSPALKMPVHSTRCCPWKNSLPITCMVRRMSEHNWFVRTESSWDICAILAGKVCMEGRLLAQNSERCVCSHVPLDLWLDIFSRIPERERREVLPLVCQEWRSMCSAPQLWRCMTIDWTQLAPDGTEDSFDWCNPDYAKAFFARRRDSLTMLDMQFKPTHTYCVSEILRSLCKSKSLAKLTLYHVPGSLLFFSDDNMPARSTCQTGALIWSAVAHLTSLQSLVVRNPLPVSLDYVLFLCCPSFSSTCIPSHWGLP